MPEFLVPNNINVIYLLYLHMYVYQNNGILLLMIPEFRLRFLCSCPFYPYVVSLLGCTVIILYCKVSFNNSVCLSSPI